MAPKADKAGKAPKAEKAPKKEKDPNKPKNAKSAYIFYTNELRTELKAADPTMTMPEISKEAGRRWRELTDEEKEPYNKLAAEDKKRAEREKAAYAK